MTSSLASRSKRLLAAVAAAESFPGRSPGSTNSKIAQSLFGRASGLGLGRKAFWGGGVGGGSGSGSCSGSDGGGGGGAGGGGAWEALDVVVKEAISEAFAAADKEFIATSRLPEVTVVYCLLGLERGAGSRCCKGKGGGRERARGGGGSGLVCARRRAAAVTAPVMSRKKKKKCLEYVARMCLLFVVAWCWCWCCLLVLFVGVVCLVLSVGVDVISSIPSCEAAIVVTTFEITPFASFPKMIIQTLHIHMDPFTILTLWESHCTLPPPHRPALTSARPPPQKTKMAKTTRTSFSGG